MGKFFKDLPPIGVLTPDTLFAVSKETTIKTFKATIGEITGNTQPVSGAEVRLQEPLFLSDGLATFVQFKDIRYDIATEFDTGVSAFEPIYIGLYLVTISVCLSGIPSWSLGDRLYLSIVSGINPSDPSESWNTAHHEFTASSTNNHILSVTGTVYVDDPTDFYIKAKIIANFTGGSSRTVPPQFSIGGATTVHSNIQISRM